MANELPALPFFTSDFLIAVATWPPERVGAYCLALFYQWEHEYVPAHDPKEMALIFHVTSVARAKTLWKEIAQKFDLDSRGRARNIRLEEHRNDVREAAARTSGRGKKGARARWHKERLRKAQASAHADAQASAGHHLGNGNQNQSHEVPPLPPAARGDAHVEPEEADTRPVTRTERKEALEALRDWRNKLPWQGDATPSCPHEDRERAVAACETEEICVGIVVQRWRQQRAVGQQRALKEAS